MLRLGQLDKPVRHPSARPVHREREPVLLLQDKNAGVKSGEDIAPCVLHVGDLCFVGTLVPGRDDAHDHVVHALAEALARETDVALERVLVRERRRRVPVGPGRGRRDSGLGLVRPPPEIPQPVRGRGPLCEVGGADHHGEEENDETEASERILDGRHLAFHCETSFKGAGVCGEMPRDLLCK